MPIPDAIRAREYRTRRDAGRVCLTVAVEEVTTVATLIEHGLLAEDMQDSRRAIAEAIEKLIVTLCGTPDHA
jgi:hypothetical protein